MKNVNLLFIFTIILSSFFSCKSTKDLSYFPDVTDGQFIENLNASVPAYRIKANDNLYVSIKTLNPEVNSLFSSTSAGNGFMSGTMQMYGDLVSQSINGYQVDSLGQIKLPILGNVEVKDQTIDQIENTIQESANIYLKDPVVKVKLLSFNVNIGGEVKNPGMYYNYRGSINVIEAINLAGGITDNAEVQNVTVLRNLKDGIISYKLDLSSSEAFNSDAFYLHPSDAIIVMSGKNKKIDLNLQTFSLFMTSLSTIFGLQFLYQEFVK